MWLRDHLRSLKLVLFKSLDAVSYSPSVVTMAVSVAVCEIFSVNEWCDLENRFVSYRIVSAAYRHSCRRRRVAVHEGR